MDVFELFGKLTLISESFIASLLLAAIWLLITRVIAPLRRNPVLSYGIAIVIAVLQGVLWPIGVSFRAWGGALAGSLLYVQMQRVMKVRTGKIGL
jgi:hypothetical protein